MKKLWRKILDIKWRHDNKLTAGYVLMRVSQLRLDLKGLSSTVDVERRRLAEVWSTFTNDLIERL